MNNELKLITKVEIESEGEINGLFIVSYVNGSVQQYWSCDQGFIEDEKGNKVSEELNKFLMDLWFAMDFSYVRFFANWTSENGLSKTTGEIII